MFYYIKQSCTMSYPIRLVETESDLIVRSVENGLGRWALVVAVKVLMLILFQLSQTWIFVLRIQEEMFSSCPVPSDSKETKLESSRHELSPSTGKNTGAVLTPCCCWKCVPIQLFTVMWIISRSLSVIWYNRWVLSEGLKVYFKDWCLLNSQPNFLFLNCFKLNELWSLSEGCKPDNFELQNFLKLSFTNIRAKFCCIGIFS